MILIKHVDYEIVPDTDSVEFYTWDEHLNYPPGPGANPFSPENEPFVKTERVKAKLFIHNGQEIYIATSKQAQDAIGIQYKAWTQLENELDILRITSEGLREKIHRLTAQLDLFHNATFIQRLRFLLFGYLE